MVTPMLVVFHGEATTYVPKAIIEITWLRSEKRANSPII
jgi:hypothetical protein